jgi:two-component system response regulator PilR (NtrC family)
VTVNCGALPETLLESELFGYMKGAFTGAASNKQGLFETAHGGTIFLDEISATSPALQIKLLRVLQERELMRVGGTACIKVDLHIIAASNKDLLSEIAKGTFREDLFYRLNVIPIHLPSLRERKDDIPLLVDFFLKKLFAGREPKKITPDALNALVGFRWPGNVRELENTVERLTILCSGDTIRLEHIPDSLKSADTAAELISADIPDEGLDRVRAWLSFVFHASSTPGVSGTVFDGRGMYLTHRLGHACSSRAASTACVRDSRRLHAPCNWRLPAASPC